MMFWVWMGLTLCLDFAALMVGKKYILEKEPILLIIAIVLFAIMGFTMTQMLQYREMAIVSILWGVIISILLIAGGYFFFQEKLTVIQLFGIFVCILGIALIEWPTK